MVRPGQRISCLLLSLILVLFFCPVQGTAGRKTNKSPENCIQMNIAEAVAVALRYNRDVKRAYITRVMDKFSLKVAEAEFAPDFNLTSSPFASGGRTQTEGEQGSDTRTSYSHNSAIRMDKGFEHGGSMRFPGTGPTTWQIPAAARRPTAVPIPGRQALPSPC